eukprot:959916-Pelagomonas_calceolata.AAC.3
MEVGDKMVLDKAQYRRMTQEDMNCKGRCLVRRLIISRLLLAFPLKAPLAETCDRPHALHAWNGMLEHAVQQASKESACQPAFQA